MKKTIIELLVMNLVLASFIIPSTNAVLSSNPSENLIYSKWLSKYIVSNPIKAKYRKGNPLPDPPSLFQSA